MAAYVPVVGSVKVKSGNPQLGLLGAAVTDGQGVYIDNSVSPPVLKLSDCNDADTAKETAFAGITLVSGAVGQYVPYLPAGQGSIDLGIVGTVGQTVILGATPGAMNPIADLATNWRLHYIGYWKTASELVLMDKSTGVTAP